MKGNRVAPLYAVIGLLVSLPIFVFGYGCAGKHINVTNLPPGVTLTSVQDWISASADLKTVSDVTHNLQQAVNQAHMTLKPDGTPIFPDGPEYGITRRVLGEIAVVEIDFANWLKTVPATDFTLSTKAKAFAFVNQILGLVQTLNTQGITGIKNPTSLTTINGFITDIRAGLALISLFVGGSAPTAFVPVLRMEAVLVS